MTRTTVETKHHVPRIYLATPLLRDGSLDRELPALMDAADVAAVLLRLAPADDRTLINRLKALAPPIQQRGVAVLLEGHTSLVARAGVDGAHVSGIRTINEALSALKPDRMVGAGGLHSRHDAMLAAEAGADYVLFGEPDPDGRRPSLEAIVERLTWWADVFEPPCVGYAHKLDEISVLAATGADFILLGDAVWADARGARQALTDAADIIATTTAASARMKA
jgi:thiamine-phosphate pyrophosphorylase